MQPSGKWSDDRQWWWNGERWVPWREAPAPPPPAAPVAQPPPPSTPSALQIGSTPVVARRQIPASLMLLLGFMCFPVGWILLASADYALEKKLRWGIAMAAGGPILVGVYYAFAYALGTLR